MFSMQKTEEQHDKLVRQLMRRIARQTGKTVGEKNSKTNW